VIAFGPWSTILGLGALFGFAVALALLSAKRNRCANQLLAALLALIALRLMPYVIGYAGFYDAYPWLSFAPFDLGLGFGPLLYLHVLRLTSAGLPPRWRWHLLPLGLQLLYYCAMFVTPLSFKNHWDGSIHAPLLLPLENLLESTSLGVYLLLAWRRHQDYQQWLKQHISDTDRYALSWLRNVLVALLLMLLASAGYALATYALQLDYFARFPLYLGLTVLTYYLGLEGWRHAEANYPLPVDVSALPAPVEPSPERDWRAQGEAWLATTQAQDWWRDPDLSLDKLARHLGTNTAYLSRALNEGLGFSFSEAIHRLRVKHVCAELDAGSNDDLLTLALAAGFSAKSSFNRIFKAQTGQTPSQYRQNADLARTKQ
jgi:AraC-like DNA-binding protein